MAELEEELMVDRLCSGDRPSVYIAGMLVAHALKRGELAIISKDVLGRVILLPPQAVELKSPVRLKDEDLHARLEDEAIMLMVQEGRTEEEMVGYLRRRKEALHGD